MAVSKNQKFAIGGGVVVVLLAAVYFLWGPGVSGYSPSPANSSATADRLSDDLEESGSAGARRGQGDGSDARGSRLAGTAEADTGDDDDSSESIEAKKRKKKKRTRRTSQEDEEDEEEQARAAARKPTNKMLQGP